VRDVLNSLATSYPMVVSWIRRGKFFLLAGTKCGNTGKEGVGRNCACIVCRLRLAEENPLRGGQACFLG
jgi:hypothetical protein